MIYSTNSSKYQSLIICCYETDHSDYNVVCEEIYAIEMSNGGFMTNRVAWEMSNIIVAMAPVAGPTIEKFSREKLPFD